MIPASSLLSLLVEAAARSLLLAASVALGLALLRVRNVVAQKAAWALVLCASLAMPLLARWAAQAAWLPRGYPFVMSAWQWPSPHATKAAPPVQATASTYVARQPASPQEASSFAAPPAATRPRPHATSGAHFPSPAIRHNAGQVSEQSIVAPSAEPAPPALNPAWIAVLLYLAVCTALLLRMLYGLYAAARMWSTADPVTVDPPGLAAGLRLRSSRGLSSPVTVGSAIVLPADYAAWDTEKLRIVLAHEASHVSQRDFYLQLCASVYAVLFWFSPLGWWLKRKLSDLSETISDRAAVRQAASHASYAQILLQFAAAPRPIQFGVAMAHHRRLIPRIERLLNESSFRQAFAGGRARIAAAILLVPVALFAATALVRVEAAKQQNPPVQAPDSLTGTAASSDVQSVAPAPQTPAAPAQPTEPAAPMAPPAGGTTAVPPGAPGAPIAPLPPDDNSPVIVGPDTRVITIPGRTIVMPNLNMMALKLANKNLNSARMMALMQADKARVMAMRGNGWRFGWGNGFGDGGSYAYVTGEGEKNIHFSGNWFDTRKGEIEKARKVAHGDFLWFERDGKFYVIDDQALLAPLKPMQNQMDSLGEQQEALGKQQEELGRRQEELGHQQELASVPTPDVSKELAELNASISKLNAQKGGTITGEQLAELEEKIGNLQGKIGDIEGKIGEKQGELGEKQGELGEQQGRLGEQQGRLGEQQGRLAREMDGKVLTIIDESMKSGKARPVE